MPALVDGERNSLAAASVSAGAPVADRDGEPVGGQDLGRGEERVLAVGIELLAVAGDRGDGVDLHRRHRTRSQRGRGRLVLPQEVRGPQQTTGLRPRHRRVLRQPGRTAQRAVFRPAALRRPTARVRTCVRRRSVRRSRPGRPPVARAPPPANPPATHSPSPVDRPGSGRRASNIRSIFVLPSSRQAPIRGMAGSPQQPLDALHRPVAEVDRQRGGEEPEVPRDRRQGLVVARRARTSAGDRVGMAGVDDPAARRAGAVDLHRRRGEEPVARVTPRHRPLLEHAATG